MTLTKILPRRSLTMIFFAACSIVAVSQRVQGQPSSVTMGDFSTGSEFENYLRALQDEGIAPLYPWSIRGFSPVEVSKLAGADSTGPWALRKRFRSSLIDAGAGTVSTIYNSAFPYGFNDGPVWAGRGMTVIGSASVSGRFGPLSFTLAPVVFRANNDAFPLLRNGLTGNQAYNTDSVYALRVDYPQRFGPDAYSRVDLGESGIRVDTRFATAGIATGNQWIGPASEYPFLLSNNAPGFPHIFLGTGEPVNVWVAHVHARLMWGKLYQSDYGPVTGGARYTGTALDSTGTVRLASSVTLVAVPRGIPGLEIGIARFFHTPYSAGEPGSDFWTKPFKLPFIKNEFASGDTLGLDNQLASAFFRWTFPASGFEVYGERGFEDQFYDRRDLLENFDHDREYMLGFQKTVRHASSAIDVFKGEVINYQLPSIAQVRGEGAIYLHASLHQGHTNRGQLLGASPAVGTGAASVLSWMRYSTTGRTGLTLRRIVRDEAGSFYLQPIPTFVVDRVSRSPDPSQASKTDVIVSLGFEKMRFTRYGDFGGRIEGMEDYNRNFADNVANLNFQLIARLRAW